MKLLIMLSLLTTIMFQGCTDAVHDYKKSEGSSTIVNIGSDSLGNDVYVREIVIQRGGTYNIIFVYCEANGTILSGTIF